MKKIEEMTYSEAIAELEEILASLRSDSCDVDTLAARTRRAVELLKACRSRLTATDNELKEILAQLDSMHNA